MEDGHNYYVYEEYDEYEDETCNITNAVKFGAVFNPVFFSIVVVLSVFGNGLVILILIKYENLKSLTNALILNLAASDLLFTASLPFWIYYSMYRWTLGEVTCKIVNFVFYIGFYSSGVLLILMTIHRYIAVVNPLSNIVSTKGLYSVLASAVIWPVSILLAVPSIVLSHVPNGTSHCEYMESSWSLWGIYQQNILFIITSVVFIFCYSQIICRLLRPTSQRRKSRTLKVIFSLMLVFFLGWAPYNVVMFLKTLKLWDKEDVVESCAVFNEIDYVLNVCRLCAFSHCCLNPVFYVFVGVKFKNHLMRLLKDLGRNSTNRNNNSIRSRHSRMTITSVSSGEEFSL